MKNLGEIISTYRKKNHLSQTELSSILLKNGFQIGNKTISNWENKKEKCFHTSLHLAHIS